MNLQDIQNAILSRLRAYGVNWASNPTNTSSNFFTPYESLLYINQGYNDFLSRTAANYIGAIQVYTNPITNAYSIPLNPIATYSASGSIVNPSALRVWEFIYTQQNSFDRRVEIIATDKFRAYTEQYQSRFMVYTDYPEFATQLFGRRQLDFYPGSVNNTDTIKLTIIPDPSSSPANCPASNGGALAEPTDIPLFPPQFHQRTWYITL